MPFAGFEDWDECIQTMTDEEDHDQQAAENICGALQAEAKADNGDPEGLRDALRDGAGLIADVGVDLVSGVDVPAIDSKWVMLKSEDDGHDYQVTSPILLDKADSEKRISYAAAMIPREPDKEGDVVPTATVEAAAHDFLKADGGIDTDHSLIDGEGDPVESWVLKEERSFDLPGGGTETYPAGTWMLGVEWGAEAWDRIKSGELSGLSIYGMAEHVPLERAAKCAECGESVNAAKSQNGDSHKADGSDSTGMGSNSDSDGGDGADDGPTLKDLAERVDTLSETVESVKDSLPDEGSGGDLSAVIQEFVDRVADVEDVDKNPDAIKSDLKAALKDGATEKQDPMEAAAMLADQFDMGDGEDLIDLLEEAQGMDPMAIVEQLREEANATDEDEEEDDEMAMAAEKRADEANLSKGSDSRQTAAKGIEDDSEAASSGLPSYKAAAEEHGD